MISEVLKTGRISHSESLNPSVLTRKSGEGSNLSNLTKRIIDIVGSSVLIVIFSPIMLAIAIAIKVTSKGPILYKQQRIGEDRRNGERRRTPDRRRDPGRRAAGDRRKGERRKTRLPGKPFYIYKFRSMVADAEEQQKLLEKYNEASGPLFKMKDDPRVTPVGRFIRRYSLDELPQLFNVLKGDMSLVGPRPGLLKEIERYEEWQKKRLKIKQGLTGLWQVSGRSNLSFNDMIKMDLEYVEKRSLLMDLKILAKTALAVLRKDGAY